MQARSLAPCLCRASPHVLLPRCPFPCLFTRRFPAGRGGGSAGAGQELPSPSVPRHCQSGRSRVAGATHALCSCARSCCQCRGSLHAAPRPRAEGQVGAVPAYAPLSRGGRVCGGGVLAPQDLTPIGGAGRELGRGRQAPLMLVWGRAAASCPCSGTRCPGTAAPTGAAPSGAWRAWTSPARPTMKGTPHPLTRACTTASGTRRTAPSLQAPSRLTVPSPSAPRKPPLLTLPSQAPASPLTGAT